MVIFNDGHFSFTPMTDDPATSNTTARPRRMSGAVIFGLFFLIMLAISYRPSVETIYCDETTLDPKPEAIMLGAWWCTYCYKARRYFQSNDISYCEYDMERDAEGKRLYKEVNGAAIPVILIGEYQINGYSERAIENALQLVREK